MQPEQQQRIMGYFIEEAKDHLNTIEQGLLNLQSTMEDTEMVNEVFRAAHSVKGGAAMLGLNSIQKTAHRLEDCFKVLKESPVKADNQLESLFLRVFDTLQALVEQLQGPFGLTDDTASGIMLDAEPVFEALNTHLKELLKVSGNSTVIITEAPKAVDHRGLISAVAPSQLEAPLSVNGQLNGENTKAIPVTFKRDVLVGLREMLQLFKQEDSPENREALQEHCQSLALLGEQLDLPGWGELLETSRAAIAFPQNSYRLLASLIIKEIKQAQELVLVNRSVEIVPSEQLKALVPTIPHSELEVASDAQEQENFLRSDTNFKAEAKEPETAQPKVNTTAESHSSTSHLFNSNKDTYILEDISEAWKEEDFTQYNTAEIPSHQTSYQGYSRATTGSRSAEPSDPEVGMAELNSLADIFEGQTPDLDQTWQEEEIISLNDRQWAEASGNPFSMDDQSDFSDLLGDTDDFDISAAELSTGDDFMGWLGEDSTEEVPLQLQESIHSFLGDRLSETTPSTTESDNSSSWDATMSDFANEADALGMPPGSDFSDLLFESDSSDPITAQAANADELKSLFGDNFFEDEENTSVDDNTADFVFDADAMPEAQQQDEDFFDMSAEQENDSLGFEDPFAPELDDLDSNESQHEEAAIAESEFDFDDLLEISDSANPAASQEQGVANLEESFSFDELVLDESVADFDFAAGEELTQSSWEFDSEASSAVQMSESADWSVDDSWLDASTHVTSETEISTDSGLEDFFSTDELNDSEALAWQQEDENALNDLDIEDASTYATGETAIPIDTGLEDFFSTDELNDSEALAWQQEDENALEASAIEDGSTTVTSETAIPIDTGLEDFFSTDELNDSEALAWQQEDENALNDLDIEDASTYATGETAIPIDTGLEDFFSTDELNDSEALAWQQEDENALNALDIDLEWDDTDTTVIQMTGIDLEWDDMDATVIQRTETETDSEATDSEAWLSDTAQASGFDFDIDATSTSPFNFDEESNGAMDDLFENESSSLVEASQNDAFNDSEDFDDLLGQETVAQEALTVEGLGLELIEELEATPNIEGLDDFLDVADVTDTSVEDNSLDFDDFSIFEQSAAVDNGEAVQDTFEEQLLDTSTDDYSEIFSVAAASELEAESLADNSESLFDTDDDALFEMEAETAANVAANDLEALFGDETSEDTDALNLPSVEMEAVNFEEDLFGGEASSQEWDFEPEAQATAQATTQPEAAIFDGEAETTPQTAADTPGWDLDDLWSEETSEEADASNLPSVEMETLNFEEDLFGGEASSQEWDWEPEAQATAQPEAAIFDGEAETTPQTAADTPGWDLDELWSDETSGDADALNLPSVEMETLNFEEDLFGGEASSQEWDWEPEAQATAQPEAAIFDGEAETTPQTAADTPGWDLDELWSDETSGDADALNLPSVEMEALNFEEDLFGGEASSQEWDLEPEAEATAEATAQPEAAIFDGEAETTPQTAADTPGWDLDELWSDETSEEADALNLPSVEMEALNFEEDLFGNEASSQEWDLEPEAEATAQPEASIFDWEAETAPQAAEDLEPLLSEETSGDTDVLDVSEENLVETELPSAWELDSADEGAAEDALDWEGAIAQETTESLEDFLGVEIDDVTDTQDWDEFVTEHQGSSEEWSFEAEEDETAAALGLDWETTDSDRASEAAPEELELPNLQSSVAEPVGASPVSTAEWDGWDDLLTEEVEGTDQTEDFSFLTAQEGDQALDFDDSESLEDALFSSSPTSEFDDLEAMLFEETTLGTSELDGLDSAAAALTNSPTSEFDDLEAMLAEGAAPGATFDSADIDFHDLEALLSDSMPANAEASRTAANRGAAAPNALEDDFGDLEKLLEQADKTMGPPTAAPVAGQTRPPIRSRPRVFEQTMRVPVKHLDSLSNLVGELVVNRNSLEQDQERLRQFLDNLSHQVLALSDVGSRMQDLYERSLLETSLLASRQSYRSSFSAPSSSLQNHNSSGVEYDPLEMDRFTGFHLLSQEMIELIVRVRESASDIEFLVDETDQVARMLRQVTTQLQEGLTRSRMVPFAQMADRLPRAVREISMKLRKEAQLHVDGRETLIDKMILEHLSDPMTHLINNALTHGIEAPDVRRAAGKPSAGQITLRAFHQGNQTVISVSDDGAGINPEQVRKKAIERRLITPAEAKNLTPLDLYNFLFHPGFTTKDSADDFAGRGVGMDVVLTSLSEIRGTIHIDSALGKGTTFTIRLPLTLSICKALCCLSDRARLAFPMDGVEDMLDVSVDRVQTNAEGQTSIRWRDTQLPFQPLSELLTYNRHLSRATVYGGKREDDMISIVVLRSGGNFIAIQVDQVLGEQEIVIKQLEGPAPKPVGIAGATVLGDGRIMPIADVLELIDLSMGRIRKDGGVALWAREENQLQPLEEEGPAKTEPMVLIVDDSITVRELLSMTFNKAGYRVEQARDGQEAWDKLRSGLPCDIVFCDIEMPRMDGLELLSRLQKDDKLSHLPIAMLTSRGADRHRQMAAQLGASGYFTKPYLEEVLLEAAQRMIKGEVLFNSNSNA